MSDTLPAVVDVTIAGGGTVYLFNLLTTDARTWVGEHVSEERQMFGSALAVEHRFAAELFVGMVADGLIVRDEEGS